MEIQVYNVEKFLDEDVIKRYLPGLSPYRRNKIENYRFLQDRALSLGATLLLAEVIEKYGIDEKNVTYVPGEYGKPRIKELPFLEYNISHSGTMVALVYHDNKTNNDPETMASCGIDVEMVKGHGDRMADRILAPEEFAIYKALKNQNVSAANAFFTREWTRKEAYLKYKGTGLDFTSKTVYEVLELGKLEKKGLYFNEIKVITDCADYCVAACSNVKDIKDCKVVKY